MSSPDSHPRVFLVAPLLALACLDISAAGELEQVVVTGRKPATAEGDSLHGFTSYVNLEQDLSSPVNLASVVDRQPGVAFSGQGGLFQTVSIRGLSRQRVGNFFMDVPLLSERRAGTAASFIDPGMVREIELVRGPATTAYGSGNIGGLVRSRPAPVSGVRGQLSWGGSGRENGQLLGVGGEAAYAVVSRRASDRAETPDGTPLNTEFEQYNLLAGGNFETGRARYELVSLASYGKDIGKSNNRFPDERVTSYPQERHWLSQLSRQGERSTGSLYFHYQDLETAVLRPAERLDTVASSALDFGARYASNWRDDSPWHWGVEYMGRRGVESEEWSTPVGQGRGPVQQTLDASQDELAFFLEGRKRWHEVELTGGLRYTTQRQDASGWSSVSEQLWSGYLGGTWEIDESWRLSAEIARGARIANLSEKYFSGTTGRGVVFGNPQLDSEIADSLDIGLIREGDRSRVELHVFRFWLDGFIERVTLGEDELSFRNQDGGHIAGADFITAWELRPGLEFQLGGHYQDGETGDGLPLQDVSPNAVSAGLRFSGSRWRWSIDYRHRFDKRDVGEGEQPVGSADLLSLAVSRDLSDRLSVTLWGRNLLDDSYLITTDDLSTEGETAAIGLELSWRS